MILFINACVRPQSRTCILADYLLEKLDDTVEEEDLVEFDFPKINNGFITYRDELTEKKRLFRSPVFACAPFCERRYCGNCRTVLGSFVSVYTEAVF